MAQSERTRGSKSPVTDYKVGNGGIRDLFKYILGGEETRNSMKVVKTRGGKSTIIKDPSQKSAVVNTVKKVMANDSNAVSGMAGDRARNIQRNMAATMNQSAPSPRITGADQTNRMRMMATYPGAVEDGTAMVEPVEVQNLPMSEDDLRAQLNRESGQDAMIQRMEQENTMNRMTRGVDPRERGGRGSYQRGEPTIRVNSKPDVYDPESDMMMTPPGAMAYGGYVKPKKKKKKKLAGGGKVTSYNY